MTDVLLKKIKLISLLILTALCLCCVMRAFPSCREQEQLSVVVFGLLIAVTALVVERGL